MSEAIVINNDYGYATLDFSKVPPNAPLDFDGLAKIATNLTPQSSAPSDPSSGWVYIDDGTNTASGKLGLRRYDGSSWNDLNVQAHSDLSGIASDDHHAKYTDAEARGSINDVIGSDGKLDSDLDADGNSMKNVFTLLGSAQSSAPSNPSAGDLYIDDGANTASGNETLRVYNGASWVDLALISELFGGAHSDLTGISANDHHNPANQNVDSVDGYDIVKDGTDGSGTINFKTTI